MEVVGLVLQLLLEVLLADEAHTIEHMGDFVLLQRLPAACHPVACDVVTPTGKRERERGPIG